jgi:hypothetical protein
LEDKNVATDRGFIHNSYWLVLLVSWLWCFVAVTVALFTLYIAMYTPPPEEGGMLFGPVPAKVRIMEEIVTLGIVSVVAGVVFALLLSPLIFCAARTKSLWLVSLWLALLYLPVVPVAILVYLHFGGRRGDVLAFACSVASVALGAVVARKLPNRVRPGYCRECGYNLTGNTSGICPECGTKTEGAKHRNRWES